ncbi:MAG TPA: hypothetical protein VG328_10610 [Stellaceae bacterium]|jgi:hypothetical protein|nr:hypothetical protein [Stellaceae bacterium]
MDNIQTTALPSDRRRTIDYLRRKARSVELQAARAAPVVAAQLKSLARLMQVEAEQLEREGAA